MLVIALARNTDRLEISPKLDFAVALTAFEGDSRLAGIRVQLERPLKDWALENTALDDLFFARENTVPDGVSLSRDDQRPGERAC
jgi:hypothetical protein